MAVLSLPLTFHNSFWSTGYRKGLEVLFNKLEQGIAENEEILTFIRARVYYESQLGGALAYPMPLGRPGMGFNFDDGASLLVTIRGLQAESIIQGKLHKAIAKELSEEVADPFDKVAQLHKERLLQSRAMILDGWLKEYETSQAEVAKTKQDYLDKTRLADEAEDDAKFAPTAGVADNYTPPVRPNIAPKRSATISERVTQRLRELQLGGTAFQPVPVQDEVIFSASPPKGSSRNLPSGDEADTGSETERESPPPQPKPKVDKGKGRAVNGTTSPPLTDNPISMSPTSLSPELTHAPGRINTNVSPPRAPKRIVLAGVTLPAATVSILLSRAAKEMTLRSVRFPLLGEYTDCFTGEEFVAWLNEHATAFGGSWDSAEEAARDLTEKEGLLRKIGELGNSFVPSSDAFYQFRPKAFDLGNIKATEQDSTPVALSPLAPVSGGLLKRSNTIVNMVSKALNNAAPANVELAHVRARHDAEDADKLYRVAVRTLDRRRLALEEKIENTLKMLRKWESERLKGIKSTLLKYQETLNVLPKGYDASFTHSSTLLESFNAESDLLVLIERYRTGPFRPVPHMYEPIAHDELDVVFGIDLRKWADLWGSPAVAVGSGGDGNYEKKGELVPPVYSALLNGLREAYTRLPSDVERRKAWIYEVPLVTVHHLREALNAVVPGQPIPQELFWHFDAAVIANAIKLWLLELDPPLALWEGWEEFRKLYPAVGSAFKSETETAAEQHIQDVRQALLKLPRVHLYVLDALVTHLKTLVETTKVDEENEMYVSKVALAIGRSVMRPKVETEMTVQDRHPTLLFIDLLKHYDAILPPTIARKKRESERRTPIRKRTAPIDMRLSRSRISIGADAKQLLAAQQAAQNPSLRPRQGHSGSITSPPLVPPTPPATTEPIPSIVLTEHNKPLAPIATVRAKQEDLPPRPTFKEPPPEVEDDVSIKQPSSTPPSIAEPPAGEREPSIDTNGNNPATRVSVTPPTPEVPASDHDSRSSSPSKTDAVLRQSVSRTSSTGVGSVPPPRGPRITRGPRVLGAPASSSGFVGRSVNRHSIAGAPPTPDSPPPNPRRMSGGYGSGGSGSRSGSPSHSPSRRQLDSNMGRQSPRSSLSRGSGEY